MCAYVHRDRVPPRAGELNRRRRRRRRRPISAADFRRRFPPTARGTRRVPAVVVLSDYASRKTA